MAITEDDTIAKLSLPNEIYNALVRNGKTTVGDLTNLCACELLDIPGLEWKAFATIVDKLVENDLMPNRECVRLRTVE